MVDFQLHDSKYFRPLPPYFISLESMSDPVMHLLRSGSARNLLIRCGKRCSISKRHAQPVSIQARKIVCKPIWLVHLKYNVAISLRMVGVGKQDALLPPCGGVGFTFYQAFADLQPKYFRS